MSLVLTIVDAWRPSLSRLQEVADFGTNPGALRMLTYTPDNFRLDLRWSSLFMARRSRRRNTTLAPAGRPWQTDMASCC